MGCISIPLEEALKYLLAGDRNNCFVDYYNMGADPDEEDAYYSCEVLVGYYIWDPATAFFATMRADAVMEAYDSLTYREKEMVGIGPLFLFRVSAAGNDHKQKRRT